MEEITLKEENLEKICRLCLQEDVDFSISIFDRDDPDTEKKTLVDRIYELFHINVRMDCVTHTKKCDLLKHFIKFSDFPAR